MSVTSLERRNDETPSRVRVGPLGAVARRSRSPALVSRVELTRRASARPRESESDETTRHSTLVRRGCESPSHRLSTHGAH